MASLKMPSAESGGSPQVPQPKQWVSNAFGTAR